MRQVWLLSCGLISLCAALQLRAKASLRQEQTGTVDAVLIEDVDDFTEWAYRYAGLDYDEDDEYEVRTSPVQNALVEGNWQNGQVTLLDRDEANDSDNPAMARFQSFIDVSPAQNPFDRDMDELPDSPDDKGKDHRKGDMAFLLVSTFDPDTLGSGQVWAVPRDHTDRSFVLLGGLQTPTGVCFDRNHDFLYVCDPAQASIYQYEIDWSDNRFILGSDQVATIVQAGVPTACTVDAYGNLYYTDLLNNTIHMVDYLDLWSGFIGQDVLLYQQTDVSLPRGIDVYNSQTLYWLNSADTQNSGLIVSAPAEEETLNSETITVNLRDEMRGQALTLSSNYAYFASTDGTVSY